MNEWSKLNKIVVGNVISQKWPRDDEYFNHTISASTWPIPFCYEIPLHVINETDEDLDMFCEVLDKEGVKVFRTKPGCYNARDIVFTVGTRKFEAPSPFLYRRGEREKFSHIFSDVEIIDEGCFDAANLLRLNDKILYQISYTGNVEGVDALQRVLGNDFEVIGWDNELGHAHIDSTLMPLNESTLLCNGDRVREDSLPAFLKDFKKIWVEDVVPRDFHIFPYSSKWIGMNVLSIDPETVVVDSIQVPLKKQLESEGFRVLTSPLRHSRTLGGGHHCITLDLEREY